MRKMLLVIVSILLFIIPAVAEDVDLSQMTREELVDLRDRVDAQIEIIDAQAKSNEEPDYAAMSLEEAFPAIGAVSKNRECTYRSYEVWEDNYYVIHIDLDTPFTYESGLVNAIRYTIDFGRRAYPLNGVSTLRFVFHQETVNKYGQSVDGTPIVWKISKSTFNKMNIDYFYDYTYTSSKRFIDACDSAAVYVAYKNAAQ